MPEDSDNFSEEENKWLVMNSEAKPKKVDKRTEPKDTKRGMETTSSNMKVDVKKEELRTRRALLDDVEITGPSLDTADIPVPENDEDVLSADTEEFLVHPERQAWEIGIHE